MAIELLPPQAEIVESGLLDSGFSCILQMATGSGKTWLAEQAIARVLERGKRAIYLAPLRALASELAAVWQKRFPDVPIGIFTGDFGTIGKAYPVSFDKACLLVMTPERLDFCTRSWRSHWDWIPEVDLVVVDEFHLLGDGRRGARLEGALSRYLRLNPFARLLCLSATLGNREELADWLGAVEYNSDWRPIPLRWRTVRYRKAEDKPRLLEEVIRQCIQDGGKSLVFVQSRRRAEQLSQSLQAAGLRAVHHHAGLDQDRRRHVENGFRQRTFEVIVATSTLEMGLNLPVRQVVLYDLQQFDGTGFVPLPTNNVWQRVGRAGRPGLDTVGEAVLLAPSWDNPVKHYEKGRFEPIYSQLQDERALAEQIIVEVSSRFARTEQQVLALLSRSLAAYQGQLSSERIQRVIKTLLEASMLYEARDEQVKARPLQFHVSPLGRVAVHHMLYPATVLRFQKVCAAFPDLTFLDLLLLVASSEDCEPLLTVDFEELEDLAERLGKEPSQLLALPALELQKRLGIKGKRLLSAIKMALVTREMTRSLNDGDLAERFGCYPFELQRLVESLERLLLALGAVVKCADSDKPILDADWIPLSERIEVLQRMVSARLDEVAVTLTQISGIGPALARRLVEHGINDIEDLAQADPDDFGQIPGISVKRAEKFIEDAIQILTLRSSLSYQEEGINVQTPYPHWPMGVDPYRLRRALELQVRMGEAGCCRVTGGTDPHLVRIVRGEMQCDCADAYKGQQNCKHVLAVRLHRGDKQLRNLVDLLKTEYETTLGVELFQFWVKEDSLWWPSNDDNKQWSNHEYANPYLDDSRRGDSLSCLHSGYYLR